MKLDCKIKIQDRQRTNGSSTLKAAKGVIGLAKSKDDEWALIVRLFKDTSATQYKVIRIRFKKKTESIDIPLIMFSLIKMFKLFFINVSIMVWRLFKSKFHLMMFN
jgi:hypothetical protein